MNPTPLVELRGLHHSFRTRGPGLTRWDWRRHGRHEVLDGASLSVQPGGRTALVGANGAGKSTLLKVLAGVLIPDTGTATLAGRDVLRGSAEVRGLVGYSPSDDRSFHWRLSARENLEFFGGLQGMATEDLRARIPYLLDAVDLSSVASRAVGALSAGMRQRLSTARALLHRPLVLLLDEPTRSVDNDSAAAIWRLIGRELDSSGAAIVATHNLDEALEYCDRLAVLADRRITEYATGELAHPKAGTPSGLLIAVENLEPQVVDRLRLIPAVTDVRIAAVNQRESMLEITTCEDDPRLVGEIIAELTRSGALIASMRRERRVLADVLALSSTRNGSTP